MVLAHEAEAHELEKIVILGGPEPAAFLGLVRHHAPDRDDIAHVLLELADLRTEIF